LPSNPPGGRSSTPTKAPAKPAPPESYLLRTGRSQPNTIKSLPALCI
jgi:hypothetical protein